ncbi:uridine kinase [Meridianimarinicoccus sp. RP-17]|uniref:uridine kinase n=1 Tax=Meridianimarinicoccus zhengii TaxID=2056810 RepID=UPI001C9A4732|nr:uridine kinase [Phycocomes zhengii]
MHDLNDHVAAVLALIDGLPHPDGRIMIGIAGPPGSGKSTLADRVVAALNDRRGDGAAALLPMDGYHLDNATLDARGLRAVKGAPDTFDAAGFVALVRRIRHEAGDLRYPLFDRAADSTVPDAGFLRADTEIVVAEGNYLLLRDGAWADLRDIFDATVMIAPPIAVLEERLIERWLSYGLSPEAAATRARGNDLANARTVLALSAAADLHIAPITKTDSATGT